LCLCFLALAGSKARIALAFKLSDLRVVGAHLVVAFLRGDQFAGSVKSATIAILQPVDTADDRRQQQQAGTDEQRNPQGRIFFAIVIIFGGFQPWQTLFVVQVKTVAGGI